MKIHGHIRISVSVVNFVLLLIAFAFLLPSQEVAAAGTAFRSSASASQHQQWRVVVTVMSEDRNEPVEGASVSVNYVYNPASSPVRLDSMTTDRSGQVYIIPATFGGFLKVKPKAGSRFDITVRHSGYIETYRNVPIRKDTQAGDISVSVSLKRKPGGKLVVVQLVEEGSRAPIYDASVKLKGTISPTLVSGTTDSGGQALITVTEADNYGVFITHTGYEPVNATLPVKMYDDQKEYSLGFEMKAKNRQERILRVFVKGKDKDGKTVPVRYAQVTLAGGTMKTTNYDGQVEFQHRLVPGEEYKVEAEATYYRPGSANFLVGARGVTGDAVTINLEREESDSLAGTWEGTSGVGGLREEWYIDNEYGRWKVIGKWFRGDHQVGSFSGEDYSYKDGRLSFTQVIGQAPIQGWKSGTRIEAWANGDSMTFRWTTPSGTGGTVTQRRKKTD